MFGEVVDFTIENQDGVAVIAAHGLLARNEVDDLQPHGTERHVGRFEYALLVRAAVEQRGGGFADTLTA